MIDSTTSTKIIVISFISIEMHNTCHYTFYHLYLKDAWFDDRVSRKFMFRVLLLLYGDVKEKIR